MRVATRPNPQIELGPVDGSCALLVCDLALPDTPIVYANDSFTAMTGYSLGEIRGRNCRFLQAPPGQRRVPGQEDKIRQMRTALSLGREVQLDLWNYRKDGTPFINCLALIPIPCAESNNYYSDDGIATGVTDTAAANYPASSRYYVGFGVDRNGI